MVFNVVKLVQVMENYKGFSLSEFVLKIKRTTEAYISTKAYWAHFCREKKPIFFARIYA